MHTDALLVAAARHVRGGFGGELRIVRCRTRRAVAARFVAGTGEVQEVQRVEQAPGSWFAGDWLVADGAAHVCTPVDAVFLALSPA